MQKNTSFTVWPYVSVDTSNIHIFLLRNKYKAAKTRQVLDHWGLTPKPKMVFLECSPRSSSTHCPPLSLLLFSLSVVSDSLQPHGLQHSRLPCPSPTPRAYSNSCPSRPLSAIRVVSSAYLRLLIFLLAILIPACASSSLTFHMMYSAGLEKVSFHSNPKERQCQRILKLPHNCTHLTCQ